MLLAIDTATRMASLALYDANGVRAELTWHSRENHTVELMAQLVHLLDLAHLMKEDLRAIGVAAGPGSFTGLRVGISVAKGMAFGSHIPLLGIPTLDAVAFAHASPQRPVWAVLSAGRGRYSTALYRGYRDRVERISDYALVNSESMVELADAHADQLTSECRLPVCFCGEIDSKLSNVLTAKLGARAEIASPAASARRAGYLAELAWSRFLNGERDDVETLAPIYTPYPV